jgi:hypothetical protein
MIAYQACGEKKVSERDIEIEAVKRHNLEEITKQLVEKAKLSDRDDIRVDDEGKVIFDTGGLPIDNDILIGLVRYLATELADARAELWLLQMDKGE